MGEASTRRERDRQNLSISARNRQRGRRNLKGEVVIGNDQATAADTLAPKCAGRMERRNNLVSSNRQRRRREGRHFRKQWHAVQNSILIGERYGPAGTCPAMGDGLYRSYQ